MRVVSILSISISQQEFGLKLKVPVEWAAVIPRSVDGELGSGPVP